MYNILVSELAHTAIYNILEHFPSKICTCRQMQYGYFYPAKLSVG